MQISTTEVVLHDTDVPKTLVDYVVANSIANLVVGASSRNMFMRYVSSQHIYLKTNDLTKNIERSIGYCIVSPNEFTYNDEQKDQIVWCGNRAAEIGTAILFDLRDNEG